MSGGLDLNAPLISMRRLSTNGARKDRFTHFSDGKSIPTLQSNHNRVQAPKKAGIVPSEQGSSPGNPKTQNGYTHALRLPPGRVASVAENGGSHPEPLVQAPVDSWVQQSISDDQSNHPDAPRQLISSVKMSRLISIDSRGEEVDNNSEAADTFLSEAFFGRVSVCSGAEEQEQVVSHTDPHARDFIMRRFLPAAQAMATESSDTFSRRHSLDSQSSGSYGRMHIGSSILHPTRFATVNGEVSRTDEEAGDLSSMASGIPLRINTHAHLSRTSFHTAFSSSKSHSPKSASWRKTDEEHSVRSEEFWSDEEAYERCEHRLHQNVVPGYIHPNVEGQLPRSALQEDAIHMAGIIKGSESDGYPMQVMGNHKSLQLLPRVKSHGFLGMPKCPINKDSSRVEGEGKQLDRVGNMLGNMLSDSNYTYRCGPYFSVSEEAEGDAIAHRAFSQKARMQDETVKVGTMEDRRLALQTPTVPTESQITASGQRKWPEKGSAKGLMPPPLPKSPSESWLWNSVPAIRSGPTKLISHKSMPAAEQANTWEAKALRSIEV
jgi:hypothetical protein